MITGRRGRTPAVRLATLLMPFLACAAAPSAEPPGPPPRVVLETRAGARHAVAVEVARTSAEQQRGLMGRRELGEEAGMLFVFPETERRAFWMKNTLIPLDMLFIDDAGVVASIVREAEPLTLTPRDSGVPCRYVLEVRGGWAAATASSRARASAWRTSR
jgi:uncharacterized membrane protein (UPF0127 family)